MDPLKNKYTPLQRLWHTWMARRDIPFRKKFFVGYDLHGNTYWEFSVDGNMQRLRRKMEPYKQQLFKADYFSTIPPQWLQWLRRTRFDPPTLEDLINDQVRQQKIKILAQHADEKWRMEKMRLEQEQQQKLEAELQKVEKEKTNFEQEYKKTLNKDPWSDADRRKGDNTDSIEQSKIKPVRKD